MSQMRIELKPPAQRAVHQPAVLILVPNIKGLVYRLSHDCQFDFDRLVSTEHCRCSSGDIVDLLSRTIC